MYFLWNSSLFVYVLRYGNRFRLHAPPYLPIYVYMDIGWCLGSYKCLSMVEFQDHRGVNIWCVVRITELLRYDGLLGSLRYGSITGCNDHRDVVVWAGVMITERGCKDHSGVEVWSGVKSIVVWRYGRLLGPEVWRYGPFKQTNLDPMDLSS